MRKFSTNLQGKVRNFSLPKDRPLVPLYEAIVNSIHAIEERKNNGDVFTGRIDIEVLRERTLFAESDSNTVKGFRIIDNGIGFNDDNMRSFMEADSEYKLKIGGKGVGRFSWLKAFSYVHIKSTFEENGCFVTREFDFLLNDYGIKESLTESMNSSNKTIIELMNYLPEYQVSVNKQIETIALKIIQHCLVYFLSVQCPEIHIFDDQDRFSLNEMFKESFASEENTIVFDVGAYNFELLNIKITERGFSHKNRLYLCANERLVDSKNLEQLITNLDSSIFDQEGFWYLGVLIGKYFDDNVDMNRLSFIIPAETSELLPDAPGLNDIVEKACEKVNEYLFSYLNEVEEKKRERITHYINEIAPQYRHLQLYLKDELASLKPNLSDSDLDDALHKIKRGFQNDTNSKCKALMKKLKKGEISTEEYQKSFAETVQRVSDVNRGALAEYVVHRRVILDLFSNGLEIRQDGKFNVEAYMHQLIYPMNFTSEELPYENHNLWLIDEKLAFCKFISSDKPFDNRITEPRPDLMILDAPVALAESKNDGTVFDSIVIFELKKPMRDDYTMNDNPITQLLDYTKKIQTGTVKDSRHRTIRVTDSTQFYLYAICDITPYLNRALKRTTRNCIGIVVLFWREYQDNIFIQ
jgi:hypothetical protein